MLEPALNKKKLFACTNIQSRKEKFVFATLVFANFAYVTLEFDISLLPLLAFDNISLAIPWQKQKI